MMWNNLCLVLTLLLPISQQHELYVPYLPMENYAYPGSLTLGVLMPVHLRSKAGGTLCSEDIGSLGLLQRMEAVAFAIQEVNADPNLLLNHTLGFVMHDDCSTDVTALAQSLHFARARPSPTMCGEWTVEECLFSEDIPQSLQHVPIVGFLGAESSITTVEVAKMMTIFRIPHVSYHASSPVLSNNRKYPGFRRMVPSDAIQVKAIVELLKHFGWTFVNVLYATGNYGEEAFKALVRETEDTNICFNLVQELDHNMSMVEYMALVNKIINQSNQAVNVSVVIVFAPSSQGRDILKAASGLPIKTSRITWIASTTWVNHIEELDKSSQQEAVGMISVSFDSCNVPRFDEYFQNITAGNEYSLNPWLDNFWQTYHNCSINDPRRPCNNNARMADHSTYSPDKAISLVFDAVYTFALALDKVISGPCLSIELEEVYSCIDMYLNEVLKETNFTGSDEIPVSFDENGDRLQAQYIIQNVQDLGNDTYELVTIGMYFGDNESLIFNEHDIHWTTGNVKPTSVCSVPCRKDEGTVYQQKRCCWDCKTCRDDEYLWRSAVNEDIWFCVSCPVNQWPNSSDRTQCIDIIPTWLSITDPLGTAYAVIATVGIAFCVLVLLVFVLNHDHVLIKASSRELMFLMLAGLIVCYFFVFTFLIKPTEYVCILKMFGVSVSFTIIYSPMSIKSIRIYRIFESGKKMNRKPRLVTCRSQLIMATSVVLLHVS